ncbi:MAG: hypothetical protein NVSMB9_06270 [Isosphaeraceae bacterium]
MAHLLKLKSREERTVSRGKTGIILLVAACTLAVSARVSLQAQAPSDTNVERDVPQKPRSSIQDALLQPYTFAFNKPTSLDEVARRLSRDLDAPIAIDKGAIDRRNLKMNDEVQLVLKGVRLQTGLKLLLDQLDLTYKVVPEDNLLIITDRTGSIDPLDRILSEIKALHRDLHDVQDAVDQLRAEVGSGLDEPRMRKPTIIEEMPDVSPEPGKAKQTPPSSSSPRNRPGT